MTEDSFFMKSTNRSIAIRKLWFLGWDKNPMKGDSSILTWNFTLVIDELARLSSITL